jgi:uroporphyrinogen decarboxylase
MPKRNPSHRERLEACLSGEILDRPPVSLWRHFPVDDQTPDGLAAATADFQNRYDFDFIKVTPASSYAIRDWGVEDQWNGNTEGTRDYTKPAIHQPEDWDRLPVLDPLSGSLGDQLHTLRSIVQAFSPETPVVQTIFSPLSQAKNLIGRQNLHIHIRQNPQAVHAGLERITQTTIRHLEEVVKTGVDGIFYAVQHAQYGINSDSEFEEFGAAYDLRVLKAAQTLWLNIAHIHGEDVMFERIARYPVQVLNWHDRHTPPSLAEARQLTGKALCGGLRRWETMVVGTPKEVCAEALEAIQATQGRLFILGTGCVLPIIAPRGNILAARRSVENEESQE